MATKYEKPINPKKLAKLMLLDIYIQQLGKDFFIVQRHPNGGNKTLRHGQGSSRPNGFLVKSKTRKRAVSKALQSMDKTRFYWE